MSTTPSHNLQDQKALVRGATSGLDLDTCDTLFASNVRASFFLVAAFAPARAARGRSSRHGWAAEFSPIAVCGKIEPWEIVSLQFSKKACRFC
jgi:hypothetical protein